MIVLNSSSFLLKYQCSITNSCKQEKTYKAKREESSKLLKKYQAGEIDANRKDSNCIFNKQSFQATTMFSQRSKKEVPSLK